jgi:hypothetical protein
MHPVARVLRRPLWLVWLYLLLGAPVTVGAAASVTIDINSGGQRHHVIASGHLGDTHGTLTPVTHHRIDDGPANDADTIDPAGPPSLAIALTSPVRVPTLSSVRVSCRVVGLHSFRLLGPVGSRPPPFSR